MVKECFKYLISQDYPVEGLNYNLKKLIECLDDNQLAYMCSTGLKINGKDIVLYFNGWGFTCMNENANIYGRKPICNIIEKKLNEKLSMLRS